MGSSKKHKSDKDRDGHREHKRKRRHKSRSPDRARDGRSRSRSPSHKKHKHDKHDKEKKRKRERDYLEEIRADRYQARQLAAAPSKPKEEIPEDGEIPEPKSTIREAPSSGDASSLSIGETNKLRAKLGLAPLKVESEVKAEGDAEPPKAGEDVHKPPPNLAELKRQAEIKEKLALIREKRKINQKLGKVKTLADSDSDEESTLAWINKNRRLVKEREMAEKRAKLLDQMDEEFGVGDLVEEAFGEKKKEYSSKDLTGLTVRHDTDRFKEGHNVILTLQDSRILDEKDDVLVNVNLIDDEKADLNNELKKKKPEYNPYDDPDDDGFGYADLDVLAKYDEKVEKKFTLGRGGQYKADYERQMAEFKEQAKNRAEVLSLPPLQLASEYYTNDEMEAKFKKVKKKVRKIRRKAKILKADDLEPIEDGFKDLRKRGETETDVPKELIERTADIPGLDLVEEPEELDPPLVLDDTDAMVPEEDMAGGPAVYDEAGFELELAIKKARKVKQKKQKGDEALAARLKELDKEEDVAPMNVGAAAEGGQSIVLNSTSEFCRTLGDIPTYGQAGNRDDEEEDMMDLDKDLDDSKDPNQDEEDPGTGWQSVEIDTRPVDIKDEDHAALEEEPIINAGIAGALELAKKKGLLDQQGAKRPTVPSHTHIQAQHYSIEDKRYDDLDEKYRKRDRYHMSGMTSEFRELDTYKPNVKLEYVDETGRLLSSKEAFRQLSHRFHGKGSGKKKTEKRAKKHEQDMLLKTASSTDTPLGTVALLQEKQKIEQSPYIVLSGSNKGMTASTISKPV